MSRGTYMPPAQSGAYITKVAKHVKIHDDKVDKLAEELFSSMKDNKLEIPDTGANITYLGKEDSRAVDFLFVGDALNFCFWTHAGAEKYAVEGHTGYYALLAALIRAVKEGHDITNSEFYSKVTEEQLRIILRSDNKTEIPLFNERISVLHEVGTILIQKYGGTFRNCLKEADKSAVNLLQIIVDNFPCFRDEAEYCGTKIALYKRAQILVVDIWNFFNREGWGEFKDIDRMTMFADYRIPQVLAFHGVVSYSSKLMKKLETDVLLPSGSEEEVEIRGCSIHAVELIKERIEEKIKQSGKDMEVPNSGDIANYLWCYRRKYADQLQKIPFHKTLGIYY